MQFKDWMPVLLEWAKTEEHRAKVAEANRRIAQALAAHRKPYVAFSGGKDSTVVLHLVLQHDPGVMVLHWDYGRFLMPRWLEEEIVKNCRRVGARNLVIRTSERYEVEKRNAVNVWGREFFGRVAGELLQQGYDLAFVGLREEESLKRRRRIRFGRKLGKIDECWPIQDWSWKDVWGYIFSNNLPYVSVYERYADLVGIDKARFVTFFDKELEKLGASNVDGMLMWRDRNREVFHEAERNRRP